MLILIHYKYAIFLFCLVMLYKSGNPVPKHQVSIYFTFKFAALIIPRGVVFGYTACTANDFNGFTRSE